MTTKLAFNQIEGNVINVKDNGAVGDGVTDDQPIFQDSVKDTLVVETGDPATTEYNLASMINITRNNIEVKGHGTIKNSNQDEYVVFTGGDGNNPTNVKVEGFTVKNAGSGATDNFSPFTSEAGINNRFDNNIFKDTYLGCRLGYDGKGLLTDRSGYDCQVKFNYFDGTSIRAIENFSSQYSLLMGNNVNALTTLGNDGKGAIRLVGSPSISTSHGAILTANNIRSNGIGISSESNQDNINIVGNFVEGGSRGIETLDVGSGHNITGNILYSNDIGYSIEGSQGCNLDGVINDPDVTGVFIADGGTTSSINNRIGGVINSPAASYGIEDTSGHNKYDLVINNAYSHGAYIQSDYNHGDIKVNTSITGDCVRLTGSNNNFNITAENGATADLRILGGDNNNISCVLAGDLIITGNNNIIRGVVNGTITDSGTGNDYSGVVGYSGKGKATFAVDGSGYITIAHGMKVTPVFATGMIRSDSGNELILTGLDATNITFRVRSTTTGAAITAGSFEVNWKAEA